MNKKVSPSPLTISSTIPVEIQRTFRSLEKLIAQGQEHTAALKQQLDAKVSDNPDSMLALSKTVRAQLQAGGSAPLSIARLPGVAAQSQPVNPASTTAPGGAYSSTAPAHQFFNSLGTDGKFVSAQPAAADLIGGGVYPFVNFTAPTGVGFTWLNQGTSTVALTNGVLSLKAIGTGSDQMRFYGATLPAPPWTVIAAFIPGHSQHSAGQGYFSEGLALSDGTKFRTLWLNYPGNAGQTTETTNLNAQGYDNTTTINAGQNIILRNLLSLPVVWLKIHDDGTTRSFYISGDPTNVGWQLLGTELHANYLTPTVAGFAMNAFGAAVSGITLLGMPWLSWQLLNV